jgi:hypothetical protein
MGTRKTDGSRTYLTVSDARSSQDADTGEYKKTNKSLHLLEIGRNCAEPMAITYQGGLQ